MVQWKGNLDYNQVGAKAKHLDQVNSFNVPNFFAVTRKEVEQILPEQREPENIRNTQIEGEVGQKISDAYSNIGVASEIRNASGKAKNLVGNRRETSRVSVRISTNKNGGYYRLDVGSSGLETAILELLAEYFKQHEEMPAILIQKMVEPGHSGAIITDYRPGHTLIESVKGLGIPLEEGSTQPEAYLLRDEQVVDNRLPDQQLEVSRHPVNGDNRRRTLDRTESPYQKRKILKAASRASETGKNLKYVYKRGTFYIVDAEPAENTIGTEEENLDMIKAAGNPEIEKGYEEVRRISEINERSEGTIVARKGAYTATKAQGIRDQGKIDLGIAPREEVLPDQNSQRTQRQREDQRQQENSSNPFGRRSQSSGIKKTASVNILPLNSGRKSLRTRPPFEGRYNIVSEVRNRNDIPERDVLTSYSEVFSHSSDTAVVDSRLVPKEGLEEAVEYINADTKILIASEVDRETVRSLVEADFDAVAVESQNLEDVEEMVELEERRLILDKVRED